MPRRYTMLQLVGRCQKRCDMENDALISPTEWAEIVSEAYGELYSIVWETGNRYFEYRTQLTTDGSNALNEVSDHLSTVQLTYLVQGTTTGIRRDLRALESQEESRMSGRAGGEATYFAHVDDTIYLYPTPPAGQVYELRYVPQPPEATIESGLLFDVVTPDGLTFLISCVAVKALIKAERDTSALAVEREAARLRFTESAVLRSIASGHHRVVDPRGGLLEDFETPYRDAADWWRP